MIITGEMMIDQLSGEYSSPACKLGRMVEGGEIVRLRRGLYETELDTPPYLVANEICGPSYISFDYALARHEVIPERVHVVTSATRDKRKTKSFENPLGRFRYSDVPAAAFDVGVETWCENGRSYRIAGVAKAVCDKLYKMPPVRSLHGLEAMMFDDLRFDMDEIEALDPETIAGYADLYRCTNVRMLAKFLEASS